MASTKSERNDGECGHADNIGRRTNGGMPLMFGDELEIKFEDKWFKSRFVAINKKNGKIVTHCYIADEIEDEKEPPFTSVKPGDDIKCQGVFLKTCPKKPIEANLNQKCIQRKAIGSSRVGLLNFLKNGNGGTAAASQICYLNCIVQLLYTCERFRERILHLPDDKFETVTAGGEKTRRRIRALKELRNLFARLYFSRRAAADTTPLAKSFALALEESVEAGKIDSIGEQEDINSMFEMICEKILRPALRALDESDLVQELFFHKLKIEETDSATVKDTKDANGREDAGKDKDDDNDEMNNGDDDDDDDDEDEDEDEEDLRRALIMSKGLLLSSSGGSAATKTEKKWKSHEAKGMLLMFYDRRECNTGGNDGEARGLVPSLKRQLSSKSDHVSNKDQKAKFRFRSGFFDGMSMYLAIHRSLNGVKRSQYYETLPQILRVQMCQLSDMNSKVRIETELFLDPFCQAEGTWKLSKEIEKLSQNLLEVEKSLKRAHDDKWIMWLLEMPNDIGNIEKFKDAHAPVKKAHETVETYMKGLLERQRELRRKIADFHAENSNHHYKLQSIVMRSSVETSANEGKGHYYAFVRSSRGQWTRCNDDTCTDVDAKDVLEFAGGKVNYGMKHQAVLCFYTKVTRKRRRSDSSSPPATKESDSTQLDRLRSLVEWEDALLLQGHTRIAKYQACPESSEKTKESKRKKLVRDLQIGCFCRACGASNLVFTMPADIAEGLYPHMMNMRGKEGEDIVLEAIIARCPNCKETPYYFRSHFIRAFEKAQDGDVFSALFDALTNTSARI